MLILLYLYYFAATSFCLYAGFNEKFIEFFVADYVENKGSDIYNPHAAQIYGLAILIVSVLLGWIMWPGFYKALKKASNGN